jgi:hypothetical protein
MQHEMLKVGEVLWLYAQHVMQVVARHASSIGVRGQDAA